MQDYLEFNNAQKYFTFPTMTKCYTKVKKLTILTNFHSDFFFIIRLYSIQETKQEKELLEEKGIYHPHARSCLIKNIAMYEI